MFAKRECAAAAAAFVLTTFSVGLPVRAATYTDNITADPAQFSCGYFATVEICGSSQVFAGGPRTLNAGDQLTENVTYTSRVTVPGSTSSNVFYVGLPNVLTVGGPALPGPDTATVQAVAVNYAGAPGPYTGPYTAGNLNAYYASTGFCCGGPGLPNSGFSATGVNAQFTILTSDPNLIYGTDFGYSLNLPYSPTLLDGVTGGSVGAPAILPSGLVGRITSDISGSASEAQFYDFMWSGGLLQTNGSIAGANPNADFHFQLYSVNGSTVVEGSTPTLADLTLDAGNGFAGKISQVLAPGDYEIGMFTNSPFDPQFTIQFDTPVGVAALPEPTTWALMLLGLGATGAGLRRRRFQMAKPA
jgi:hypothetical protein